MLPRPHRLPSPLIKDVMRRGRRVGAEGMQLIIEKQENIRLDSRRSLSRATSKDGNDKKKNGDDIGPSRFAVVVPMSVDKRAAVRNRVRRLVRESVRLALPVITSGYDGVFFVRKKPPDAFAVVEETVRELLKNYLRPPLAKAKGVAFKTQ